MKRVVLCSSSLRASDLIDYDAMDDDKFKAVMRAERCDYFGPDGTYFDVNKLDDSSDDVEISVKRAIRTKDILDAGMSPVTREITAFRYLAYRPNIVNNTIHTTGYLSLTVDPDAPGFQFSTYPICIEVSVRKGTEVVVPQVTGTGRKDDEGELLVHRNSTIVLTSVSDDRRRMIGYVE